MDGSAAQAADTGRRRMTVSRQTPNTIRNSATASGDASGIRSPIQRAARARPPRTAVHATPRMRHSHANASSAFGIEGYAVVYGRRGEKKPDPVGRPVDFVRIFDGWIEHERPDVRAGHVGERVREGTPFCQLRRCQAVLAFELLSLTRVHRRRPTARASRPADHQMRPGVLHRVRLRAPRTASAITITR